MGMGLGMAKLRLGAGGGARGAALEVLSKSKGGFIGVSFPFFSPIKTLPAPCSASHL